MHSALCAKPFAILLIWRAQELPQGWDSYHVALTIEWRDQGAGHQQSKLFSRITGDATWKAISGVAPHELSSTTLRFELSPAARAEAVVTLELGYEVCTGGGPAHELYVKPNAKLAVFKSELARTEAKAAEAEKTKAIAVAEAAATAVASTELADRPRYAVRLKTNSNVTETLYPPWGACAGRFLRAGRLQAQSSVPPLRRAMLRTSRGLV